MNRVVTHMCYSGGTFSVVNSAPIAEEYSVVGYHYTPAGRVPEVDCVQAVLDWSPCKSLSEARAFLGTVGVLRIFILNFARQAHTERRTI
jgi:hypothetical protein